MNHRHVFWFKAAFKQDRLYFSKSIRCVACFAISYNKAAADLAWGRTIGFFKKYLA